MILNTNFLGDLNEKTNNTFSDPCKLMIQDTIKRIERYLTIQSLDVNVYFCEKEYLIPTMRICAHCISHNEINIGIDGDMEKGVNDEFIGQFSASICHETHHAQRFSTVGYGKTLFESILSEGLACKFEKEMFPHGYFPYAQANNDEIKNILSILPKENTSEDYDHIAWFFVGDDSLRLPRRAGYKIGYTRAEELCTVLGKNAGELVNIEYEEAMKFLHINNKKIS